MTIKIPKWLMLSILAFFLSSGSRMVNDLFEFSKNIEEGYFKRGKKSIVIAKGSVLKKILSEKNFTILSNKFEELKDSNPIKPLQNYTNWYQWVYKCKDPEWTCFFLVYSKPGYDMKIAQSPEVIEIFKQILSDEYSC
jgi:hypothetical protein